MILKNGKRFQYVLNASNVQLYTATHLVELSDKGLHQIGAWKEGKLEF